MNKLAKAPFYNFALVVAHLYQQRFVFRPDYLTLLEEVVETLPFLHDIRQARADGDAANGPLNDKQIQAAYTAIAEFARGIAESPDDQFFNTKMSYLVPELDLLGSFGDTLDKYDRETAASVFSKGMELASDKKYAESINTFEIAGRLAPDYSKGAAEEIAKVSDTWRHESNITVFKLIKGKDFDRAIEMLRYPPDQRLARQNDQGLIESIERQKQISLMEEAEALTVLGDANGAKLKYKLLLREDLSEHLRKHVSTKLAKLLKSDGQPVAEDKQD
jgi:hypothetical protein